MECIKHPEARFNGRKCAECNREYQSKWYSTNRETQIERVQKRNKRIRDEKRKYVFDIISSSVCSCGESSPAALQFDHIDGHRKVTNIAKMVADTRWSLKHLVDEIKKCQILCANCHAKKTARDFGWYKDL